MFFKKKETKDVDILQQIKEKIDADNEQNTAKVQQNQNTTDFDDMNMLSEIGVVEDNTNKKEIVDDINEIVKNAVVSNDNEQNNFEDNLEEDFLNSTLDDFEERNKKDEEYNDENNYSGEETTNNIDEKILDEDNKELINIEEKPEEAKVEDEYNDEEEVFVDDNLNNSKEEELLGQNIEENKDNNEIQNENDIHNQEETKKLSDEELDALLSDLDEEQISSVEPKQQEIQNNDDETEKNINDDNNIVEEDDIDDEDIFSEDFNEDVKVEDAKNDDKNEFLEDNLEVDDNDILSNATFNDEMKNQNYIQEEIENELELDNNKNTFDNIKEAKMFVKNPEEMQQETNKLQLDDVRSALVGANQNNLDNQHISQKTQDSVKKSIGELIENVKNQVLSEKAKTKQRIFEGKTMEQFMYDLIRPRVIEFLDNNLEQIVQDIVNQEIKHIIDGVDE